MRIFVDTADITEIGEWSAHPWVSGFTTNPSLMRGQTYLADAMEWAKDAVGTANGKPISIDGPESVWNLGRNVWRKTTRNDHPRYSYMRFNYTAICSRGQIPTAPNKHAILSVFAGRIMDTGRDPQPVIDAARATGAQVLWASVREPYNIVQAEAAGCDIITVPPAILRKYLEWHGKPLETVAAETIAQFDKDREGLW